MINVTNSLGLVRFALTIDSISSENLAEDRRDRIESDDRVIDVDRFCASVSAFIDGELGTITIRADALGERPLRLRCFSTSANVQDKRIMIVKASSFQIGSNILIKLELSQKFFVSSFIKLRYMQNGTEVW